MIFPVPKPKPKKRKVKSRGLRQHTRMKRTRMKSQGPRTKKSGGHLFPKAVNVPYREWIRAFACLLRGLDPAHRCPLGFLGSECAHVKSRGAGGNDLGNCVPLCAFHHAQQSEEHTSELQSRFD